MMYCTVFAPTISGISRLLDFGQTLHRAFFAKTFQNYFYPTRLSLAEYIPPTFRPTSTTIRIGLSRFSAYKFIISRGLLLRQRNTNSSETKTGKVTCACENLGLYTIATGLRYKNSNCYWLLVVAVMLDLFLCICWIWSWRMLEGYKNIEFYGITSCFMIFGQAR
jgi:hypothetical protein